MAVVLALGWVAGWGLWGRPRRLDGEPAARGDRAEGSPPVPGRVAVVVPARDEAANLPGLLADVTGGRRPGDRVVVVDDGSTDATAAVAGAVAGVDVVSAPSLPMGWTGKSWACQVGVDRLLDGSSPWADGDVIVFVDADVRLAPDAVDAVVVELDRQGGAVSVQPLHTTVRPHEQLSLFCNLVSLMGVGAGRRRRPPDGLIGPLVATTLGAYQASGGHAGVRASVTEDLALGRRYRAAGLSTAVRLGGPHVRFRMYPAGVGQLIEGWTKNMATGAGSVPPARAVLIGLWVTALLSAPLVLPGVPGGSDLPAAVGAAVYTAFALQVAVLGRRIGTFGSLTAAVYPVPLVTFVALLARSTIHSRLLRRVTWRGRSISMRPPPDLAPDGG